MFSSRVQVTTENFNQEHTIYFVSRHSDPLNMFSTHFIVVGALMDQVNAHYNVYDVKKRCNMASFGRECIPGFRPDLGYGYYEFKFQDEYFKSHKRVILIHKVKCSLIYLPSVHHNITCTQNKKLYTGAGAKFICIEGQYSEKVKSREAKISPPNLTNTAWTHIFIQSRSNNRELLPGTKFLYCEYK